MKDLVRTKINNFSIENSITLEELYNKKAELSNRIISIENAFKDNKKIELSEKKVQLFLNGVKTTYDLKNGVYRIYSNNCFIGLGVVDNNFLKRDVII